MRVKAFPYKDYTDQCPQLHLVRDTAQTSKNVDFDTRLKLRSVTLSEVLLYSIADYSRLRIA